MAWTMYVQRAMRCVDPSVSHVLRPAAPSHHVVGSAPGPRGVAAYGAPTTTGPSYTVDTGLLANWSITSNNSAATGVPVSGRWSNQYQELCETILTDTSWKFAPDAGSPP